MTEFGSGLFGFGPFDGDIVSPIIYDPEEALKFRDEIVQYYINLLIIQYISRPRARQTVGMFVQEAIANRVIVDATAALDLEVAVGRQLDFIAAYRGASRIVYGLDLTRDYFSFAYYDDVDPSTVPGFALYEDDPVPDYFLLYADADRPVYSMTDDELRRFVKYLARLQSRYMSLQEIDQLLYDFFGNNLSVTDSDDMTLTYTHNPADVDNLYTIVSGTNNLPRPAGVAVVLS